MVTVADGGRITFILWLVVQMWMVGVKYSDKYRDCHVSVVVVYLKNSLQ